MWKKKKKKSPDGKMKLQEEMGKRKQKYVGNSKQ